MIGTGVTLQIIAVALIAHLGFEAKMLVDISRMKTKVNALWKDYTGEATA